MGTLWGSAAGKDTQKGPPGAVWRAETTAELTAATVRALPARVRSAEDLAHVLDGDPRVERRRRGAAVAEQLLHVADVGAATEQVRRAGVSQRVGRDVAAGGSAVPQHDCRSWARGAVGVTSLDVGSQREAPVLHAWQLHFSGRAFSLREWLHCHRHSAVADPASPRLIIKPPLERLQLPRLGLRASADGQGKLATKPLVPKRNLDITRETHCGIAHHRRGRCALRLGALPNRAARIDKNDTDECSCEPHTCRTCYGHGTSFFVTARFFS